MMTGQMLTETGTEWSTACEVQQRFMQRRGPAIDALDYSAQCRQAHELGGDCYDFVPLPDNRFALAIGDASGKGLAAALMISNVQSSLRAAAAFAGNDLPAVMEVVNRLVHESSLDDRYATLFYGVFDPASRTLRYVNAGHNPPIVIRRDGSIAKLDTGGVPVGILPGMSYEEGAVRLDAGDMVIAYTDGVVEARDVSGEEWGFRGLRRAAASNRAQNAAAIVREIFESMDKFTGGQQSDDATVAVVRVR